MTRHFLLDTNSASYLIKAREPLTTKASTVPLNDMSISAVTAGELRYGLSKHPNATNIITGVTEFLTTVEIRDWTAEVSLHYGPLRASLEADGITVAALDLMIAAHALAIDATLVTSDAIFARIPSLKIENWMDP